MRVHVCVHVQACTGKRREGRENFEVFAEVELVKEFVVFFFFG